MAPVQVDRIGAEPGGVYSVEFRDGAGEVARRASVTFSGTNMLVAAGTGDFAATATTTTDANGRASVRVKFGRFAGDGLVVAHASALGVADSIPFRIEPVVEAEAPSPPPTPSSTQPAGRMSRTAFLTDTTVVAGSALPATAMFLDRFGDPVRASVAVVSGTATRVLDQIVFPTMGTVVLDVRTGARRDSAAVRVVPEGVLAFSGDGAPWLVDIGEGIPRRLPFTIPQVREPSLDWSPDGRRMVVGGQQGFRVFDVETRETLPVRWPGGDAGGEVIWPRFAPDGRSILYSQGNGGQWDIRSADLDGSLANTLIPASRYGGQDLMPDWAPDGRAFVFTSDREQSSRYLIRIVDARQRGTTTLEVEGVTPVWSPDGRLIAYQELGQVGVVSPDGMIRRSFELSWGKGVSWSPDSRMVAGIRNGVVEVLDVETGEVLAFPEWSPRAVAVSWRPEGGGPN